MQLPLSRALKPRPITVADTILPDDEVIILNPSAPIAVTLYSPSGARNAVYIFNAASSDTTLTTLGTNCTINGSAAAFVFTEAGDGALFIPDGVSNWMVVGQSVAAGLATAIAGAAGTAVWGGITGALSNQADLVAQFALKQQVGTNSQQTIGATIATTGNSDAYITAPFAASLSAVAVTPLVALTSNDTNYLTWTITNLGQSGAGTTAMLAATAANTTQATGGTGLAINTPRVLTVNGTAGNLVVAVNDLLLIRAAATGTLANTVTRPIMKLSFTGA